MLCLLSLIIIVKFFWLLHFSPMLHETANLDCISLRAVSPSLQRHGLSVIQERTPLWFRLCTIGNIRWDNTTITEVLQSLNLTKNVQLSFDKLLTANKQKTPESCSSSTLRPQWFLNDLDLSSANRESQFLTNGKSQDDTASYTDFKTCFFANQWSINYFFFIRHI